MKPPAAAAREPRFDGLGVLEAGLAQVHVHVDEAGRDDQAGGIEHDRAGGVQIRPDARRSGRSLMRTSAIRRGPRPGSMTRPFLNEQFRHGRPRIRSSTAMRTATPFSTWLRITDRCESATSEEISRPRLMGPGCMTIASGLSRSRCSSRRP